MKKLQASYNDNANKIIEQATKKGAIKELNFLINLSMVNTDTKLVPEEPKTFAKAWNHPNANSHATWQEAIKKEFANMNKQQVWHKTKSSAPQSKVCKKQVGLQDQTQQCIQGVSHCKQVQSGTWHQFI